MKRNRLFILPVLLLYLCSCQKEIGFDEVVNNPGTDSTPAATTPPDLALNSWQFFDSTDGSFHRGIIDLAYTSFETTPSWNFLTIRGWPGTPGAINNDTMFLVTMFFPNPFIEVGTYTITSGTGGDHFFGYANNLYIPALGNNQTFCYYIATSGIAPDFTFNILSYDAEQKIVKGSFKGSTRWIPTYAGYIGATHIVSGSFYFKLN